MATSFPRKLWPIAVGLNIAACAPRSFLTSDVLVDVQRSDPKLGKLRVYPSIKFVSLYSRDFDHQTTTEGTGGAVATGHSGERLEVPVARDLPGAIVAAETLGTQSVLWISFDIKCRSRDCAFLFVLSPDGRYRLAKLPAFAGFGAPQVYRRNIADRNLMRQSRAYARSEDLPVYLTSRGFATSVALQIKKRHTVDIKVTVATPTGIPAE